MIRKKRKVSEVNSDEMVTGVWGGEVLNQKRIRWSSDLESDLLELTRQAKPSEVGNLNRLQRLWNEKHPELAITSTALSRRLYIIRNKSYAQQAGESIDDQMGEINSSDKVRLKGEK